LGFEKQNEGIMKPVVTDVALWLSISIWRRVITFLKLEFGVATL